METQVPNSMRTNPITEWIRWDPPNGYWRALNTDSAARGNLGLAGARGVLRDGTGAWIIGFSEHLGHCSAIKAEIRDVLRGLKIAKEECTHKLWLQVDSMVVVSMLTTSTKGNPEYNNLIHQCKALLDWGGWEVKISHCFRKANQVADKLANMDVEGSLGVQMYRVPPMKAREALYADSVGVAWPRRVNR